MAKYYKSLKQLRVPKKFGFFDILALIILVCLVIYTLSFGNTIDFHASFNEPGTVISQYKEDPLWIFGIIKNILP